MIKHTGVKEIFDIIYKNFRLDCLSYNQSYIERRINARIMVNNLSPDDYVAYAKLLGSSPQEQRCFYDALTINVTQFFRDIRLWDFLKKDVFRKIIAEKAEKSDKNLQIWSCGCSSGEEPYSVAIVLRELLKDHKAPHPLIIGTDIDQQSFVRADKAVYEIGAFRSMPIQYLTSYFEQFIENGSAKYRLNQSIKAMVQFQKNNFLLDAPPAKNVDIIFCRNVIIYFTAAAKEKLMNVFYETLTDHGWLVLGKSEVLYTTKMQQKFYLYNVEERVYRKERRKSQLAFDVERRKNWWAGYIIKQ
jgi:chemotaxis protein methyltransferase CheR